MTECNVTCVACDAPLGEGEGRCRRCGKVAGEVNRCPACSAIAGVDEVGPEQYVCAACGSDRVAPPGTVVLRSHAEVLERGARLRRHLSLFIAVTGVFLAVCGLAVAGLLWMFEVASASAAVALVGIVLLFLHLWTAKRIRLQASQMQAAALERRLLQEVRSHVYGVSPEEVAHTLRQDVGCVDQALTALAKRGHVNLEVSDEGALRYHVAAASWLATASEPLKRAKG